MKKLLVLVMAFILSACGTALKDVEPPTDGSSSFWGANLIVEEGTKKTELIVSWAPPETAVDHYIVCFLDEENIEKTMEVSAIETSVTAIDLQPETLYTIRVLACRSGMCMDPLTSELVYKRTP